MNLSAPVRQRGFSLTEIMITLAMGIFISAGIVQVMSSNQVTDRLNRAIASTQESGRFIVSRLRSDLLPAGRYDILDPALDASVDIVDEAAFVQNRPVILAGDFSQNLTLGSVQGFSGADDQLVVAMQGERDCRGYKLGYADDAEFFVVNHYFVDAGTLKCRGFDGRVLRGQKIAVGNNNDAAFTILDNVISFQVLYGVSASSESGNFTGTPTTYVTASALAALRAAGSHVVAIRVAILLEGDSETYINPTPTFKLLNEASITPSGNGLYKKFETTITLRNMKNYARRQKA
ncbi:MAG: prepilin-type N-terminal cleavage/methylation domain-containing protein [Alteromonadaceae bacterium]|nr:prepilin-type N-terminal cleavage/methylation domain-containing protein [Alteromonadaceae bacterium]